MTDRIFRYRPTLLTANLIHDDDAAFAASYPTHHQWLCEQNIAFRVVGYHWPEMLALIFHHQLGKTVCELQVTMATEHAARFAEFTGIQPD